MKELTEELHNISGLPGLSPAGAGEWGLARRAVDLLFGSCNEVVWRFTTKETRWVEAFLERG